MILISINHYNGLLEIFFDVAHAKLKKKFFYDYLYIAIYCHTIKNKLLFKQGYPYSLSCLHKSYLLS